MIASIMDFLLLPDDGKMSKKKKGKKKSVNFLKPNMMSSDDL